MTTRAALVMALLALWITPEISRAASETTRQPPSIVIVFADDLGYGDLSCQGHPTIRTPHLDRMAAEGMRFTQFYSADSVCTPSRSALMTGRLPVRTGMYSDRRRVLFPDSAGGLPQSEVTIAEVLKKQGYATACVGKWHLGHLPQHLPTTQGFDSYYGIPYSNDMDALRSAPKGRQKFWPPKSEYFNVPLLDSKAGGAPAELERPAEQTTITKRYAERSVEFIKSVDADTPLFLYLAHNLPHVPLFRDDAFVGHSRRGLYGDVIEEIDWSVGEVRTALEETGRADNCLVVFTSDNGPWLVFNEQGGSAGLLREGKGCTFEGGMREPMIAWGPGLVQSGVVCHELGSTLDLLPTCAAIAGASLDDDRTLDGYDLSDTLTSGAPSPRKEMYFYRGSELMAVRKGPWKAHFYTELAYVRTTRTKHDRPLLYNLEIDPSEKYDVGEDHPMVIEEITELATQFEASFTQAPTQLESRIPQN